MCGGWSCRPRARASIAVCELHQRSADLEGDVSRRAQFQRKAGKPLLQGWAIVDNTVGQDREKVQMSLVAGAPQSFIQNLSLPYYSKRPVGPLPQSVTVRRRLSKRH